MKQPWDSAVAFGGGVSLGLPFAAAALIILENPGLYPSDPVGQAVFAFMAARVAAYLAVTRLRRMSLGALIVFFSADVLLFLAASVASLATGDPAPGAFAGSFLSAWLSSGLVVFPGVVAFAIARSMSERGRLSRILPAAALSFGVSSLVFEGLGSGPQTGGLGQVAYLTVAVLRRPVAPGPLQSSLLYAGGVILFASLAAYAFTGAGGSGKMLTARLGVGVAAAAAVLGWVVWAPPLGALVTLGLPAGAIATGIWLMTRET